VKVAVLKNRIVENGLIKASTLGFWGGMAFAVAALSSCQLEKTTAIEHEGEVSTKMNVTLDRSVSVEERSLLVSDMYKLMKLDLQVRPQTYFDKTFAGVDADSVIRYLNTRVHYVIPASVALESRLGFFHDALAARRWATSSQIYTMAVNVGTALWYESLADGSGKLGFKIDENLVPLDSSRVGIIQLGQGYTLKDKGHYAFPQFARISTLIHEARHSDCTGGITRGDIDLIRQGEFPEHRECGHLHSRCPVGHNYEGAYACDQEAWGAYAVQGVFTASLVKNCANCSEAEQKVALAVFSDAISRVIPLDDMLAGKLGNPDMSSSAEVHERALAPSVVPTPSPSATLVPIQDPATLR
jgi:hypothetical protein